MLRKKNEEKARLFSVVLMDRTRGNGQKLKIREFYLNTWKHFFYSECPNSGISCPKRQFPSVKILKMQLDTVLAKLL